ncbi:MAG: nicotinate phosphoribosyltransferase [Desulfatiglandales bacterium]
MTLSSLYRDSLSLFTDLYQITMAYGYYSLGIQDKEVCFHMITRKNPFEGGYTVACGLAQFIEYLEGLRFREDDLNYLQAMKGADGRPLFSEGFLNYLKELRLRITVHAVPEGTVVFPYEPLVRVIGPLLQCQLVESALLNIVNFQSLIATKASRVVLAAEGQPVVEFGLRRAHGVDGAVSASRAAYIGGCVGTSNVLAGKLFGIPVKGTHAHSWVMVFEDELQAFQGYAKSMPNNCILLVDTYETFQGIRNAVHVAGEMKARGDRLLGIRLDSGDLAYLSQEARRILNEAGLKDAVIIGSSDLDEDAIANFKEQGAKVDMWGVGTRLVTAHGDPALTGVYKLSAVRGPNGRWEYKIKISEQLAKVTVPGVLEVRRYKRDGEYIADAIYDLQMGLEEPVVIMDPSDPTRRKKIQGGLESEELLVPIFEEGQLVYSLPSIEEARERCLTQLKSFHPSIRRRISPHQYPAGLEKRLYELRSWLITEVKEKVS